MLVTLDTTHFEMSELNALAPPPPNTAESKKKEREKKAQREGVRG